MIVALVLALLGAGGADLTDVLEHNARAPIAPSDVVVILVDDVGCYDVDDVDTPNLDSLAAQSARFVRAFNASSMCSPSRAASLCGQYSRRFGIGRIVTIGEPNDLPLGTPTIASVLAGAGWQTGFVGKWHLAGGQNYPLFDAPGLFGFQSWRAVASQNLGATWPNGNYDSWGRIDDGVYSHETTYCTAAQAAAAVDWWHATESPRFLWISFTAAHDPFHAAPAPYYNGPTPTNDRERFESMIEALDDRIGFVLDAVGPDAWIVFASDNGTPEDVAEVPPQIAGHQKQSMHDPGLRTPLYVRGPGVEPGARRRLVSTVDLFQTIADVVGVDAWTPDSLSFADSLGRHASTPSRHWIFAERFGPNGPGPFNMRERTVRVGSWKLIREEDFGSLVVEDLYELTTDPLELSPLPLSAHPDADELEDVFALFP